MTRPIRHDGARAKEAPLLFAVLHLIPVAVLPLACSPGATPDAGTVDTPLDATVDSLYTVGRIEGAESEVFSRISDVAFDREGHLLVMDEGNHRVQLFGDDGAFMASVGGRGDGPGEFRRAVDVTAIQDGLAVLDIGRNALYAFSLDGRLEAEWRTPEGIGRVELDSPDGIHLVLPGDGDRFTEPDSISLHIYEVGSPSSSSVDFRVPNPQKVPEVGEITRTPEGRFTMTRRSRAPFLPRVHLAAGGNRIAVASGSRYVVELRDSEGRISDRLERAHEPRPVTEELRRAVRDRLRESLLDRRAEGGAGSFAVRAMTTEEIDSYAESMIFPDTVPVILDLLATPEGSVWVLRSDPQFPGRPGPIDVFDPEGRYLGTFEDLAYPDALGPGGRAAWVEVDEFGVQGVLVGRVGWTR